MPKLKLTLHELEALNTHFLSFIQKKKISDIITLRHAQPKSRDDKGRLSKEYTEAIIITTLIDENNFQFIQKLLTWQHKKKKEGTVTLGLAHAVVFYHTMQCVPIPADNVWLFMLGNNIIAQLDAQIDVDGLLYKALKAMLEVN